MFEELAAVGYGDLHVKRDAATGLQALVAIHDVRLGPALGGCRFVSYRTEQDALMDALRLARGMTYKAAITGIPHGGGKSVIIKPPGEFDRAALFESFGAFIDALGGRYITAEDSGTGVADMDVIRTVTPHVTGIDPNAGGGGDPSPFTALGVRRGIEACVKFRLGRSSLEGIRVAVQGVGHVGYALCDELHRAGAQVTVADIDPAKTERARQDFSATVVPLDTIFATDCDVMAPCALGNALSDETIPQLRCTIVAGAANNQLAQPRQGAELMKRDILYAPDYAINAGGLVNVSQEVVGYDADKAREKTLEIHDTVLEIAERAKTAAQPTHEIANAMAEERLAKA